MSITHWLTFVSVIQYINAFSSWNMFFKQWVCLVHGTLLENCSAWQIGGECFVNNYSVSFGHCLLFACLSDLHDLRPGSFKYSTCAGICNLPIQRQLMFHGISGLAGQCKQYSITQYKGKLHLAKYNNMCSPVTSL